MQKQLVKDNLFEIHNRKYLGSKSNLLVPITRFIIEQVGKVDSFADIFAGTGVVSAGINRFFPDAALIMNDMLYSNYVGYQAFFGCCENEVSMDKVVDYIARCNSLNGYYGYVTHNFGGKYFTVDNSKRIDEIRDYIEAQYEASKINFKEKCILLTSLLYGIDKVANTCGQYDSYLKHLGSKCMENGVHKVDSNVYKPVELKVPNVSFVNKENLIVSMDANILVEHIDAQVVYIDPPYNTRQYVDNYHLLENIAKWEKPEVFGKTKKFNRDKQKSMYSQKRYVSMVFETLIKNIQSPHIFMSYNSEGLLSYDHIYEILSKKGKATVKEIPYNVFGNGAGQSKKRKLIEYLFHVECS